MDLQQDSVPVPRPAGKRAQHEQVQRSIGQRRRCGAHTLIARVIAVKPSCLGKSRSAGPAECRPLALCCERRPNAWRVVIPRR